MKTVNEVIKELQDLVEQDKDIGNLPVYVIADHGQTYIKAGQVTLDYTFEYEYYAEAYDLEEIEPEELSEIKAFVTIGD